MKSRNFESLYRPNILIVFLLFFGSAILSQSWSQTFDVVSQHRFEAEFRVNGFGELGGKISNVFDIAPRSLNNSVSLPISCAIDRARTNVSTGVFIGRGPQPGSIGFMVACEVNHSRLNEDSMYGNSGPVRDGFDRLPETLKKALVRQNYITVGSQIYFDISRKQDGRVFGILGVNIDPTSRRRTKQIIKDIEIDLPQSQINDIESLTRAGHNGGNLSIGFSLRFGKR